jgi:hypothetical protein
MKLIDDHNDDACSTIKKVKKGDFDEMEGGKELAKCILQHIERLEAFLKMSKVRVVSSEQAKLEKRFEIVFDKVLAIQNFLITSRKSDNSDVI